MAKHDYRCKHCGGAIQWNATASWDAATQRHVVDGVEDWHVCTDCGEENCLETVRCEHVWVYLTELDGMTPSQLRAWYLTDPTARGEVYAVYPDSEALIEDLEGLMASLSHGIPMAVEQITEQKG